MTCNMGWERILSSEIYGKFQNLGKITPVSHLYYIDAKLMVNGNGFAYLGLSCIGCSNFRKGTDLLFLA